MADRTLREILKLSPQERRNLYQVNNLSNKHIDRVIIDGNVFTDYSAFTFLMAKTFVKSPVRGADGSISNLDTYAWFLTPQLKMDFALMSIESYRTAMKLIRSKSEFTVTCYDIVEDQDVTNNMYFATEQMPKLWNIAKALLGSSGELESWVELLGVQDYTIELIGTNTDVETNILTYMLNAPSGVVWNGGTTATVETPAHITTNVGTIISTGNGEETIDVSDITFGNTYKFKYWCENPNGSGFKYLDGGEYLFKTAKTLYAIWEAGAV